MILLLLICNLWAQEVVIQAEKTTDLEYERYLLEHPTQKSFVQGQKLRSRNPAARLNELLVAAQFEFLNGNLDKAKDNFKSISEMQHEADWEAKDQDTIHFAFLRLAQLEADPRKQKEILQQAIAFHPKAAVNNNLFPPPFVSLYSKQKNATQEHIWQLPKNADLFDTILVNGKSHKGKTGFLKSVGGIQRVSFLSNKYLPVQFVTEPNNLANLTIQIEALATGPCDSPSLIESLTDKQIYLYLENDCIGTFRKDWIQQPLAAKTDVLPVSQPTASPRRFYHSKWFWIGASAIATGLVVTHLSQQRYSDQPTPATEVKTYSNR